MAKTTEQIVLELLAKEDMAASVDKAADSLAHMSDEQKAVLRSSEEYNQVVGEAENSNRRMGLSLTDLKSGLDLAKQGLTALKGAWDFAKEGAEIQRIHDQWEATAQSFGVNGDAIISSLDEIAHGTVDDERLIQVSTRAFTNELVHSSSDIEKMFKIARAASVRFGGDTAETFERIAEATEVGQQKQLKAIGIVVDFEQAYKDYAKTAGVTVAQLDELTKKQIRLNEVNRVGTRLVQEVGEATETSADKFKRLETRVGDLVDGAKELAADVGVGVLDAFDDLGRVLSGQETQMQRNARLLIEMAHGGKEGARAFLELEKAGLVTRDMLEQDTAQARELKKALDELQSSNQAMAEAMIDPFQGMIKSAAAATQAVGRVQAAQVARLRSSNDAISLAMDYTQAEQKLAEQQTKLRELDEDIARNGPRRQAIVDNQRMSEEERAVATAQLAVTIGELQKAEAELDPTQAENALKLAQMRERVGELNDSLGNHVAAIGGATKAQREQRDALNQTIEATIKANEVQRAAAVASALTEARSKGVLTEEQYAERMTAVNDIAHLYTDTALKQAVAQTELLKTMADPAAENWARHLDAGKAALDGVVGSVFSVSEKTRKLSDEDLRDMGEAGDKAQGKIKTAADETGAALDIAARKVGQVEALLNRLPARKRIDVDLAVHGLDILQQLIAAARAQGVNP